MYVYTCQVSIYIYIYQVQLVATCMYMGMWPSLEHGKLTSGYIPLPKDSPSSSKYPLAPKFGDGTWRLLTTYLLEFWLTWSSVGLVQVAAQVHERCSHVVYRRQRFTALIPPSSGFYVLCPSFSIILLEPWG